MWIFKAILASAVLFLAAVKAQEEGKNTVTNIPLKMIDAVLKLIWRFWSILSDFLVMSFI